MAGRVPSGQALAVPATPAGAVDGPSGFDPSRELTSLSYWFPKVEAAGLPVPKTRIMHMPLDVCKTIFTHLWGEDADPSPVNDFIAQMRGVAEELGAPFFLRTDLTSGKHHWETACFVADPSKLASHVYQLAEYSELAGFPGLPWDTWVLREMLPTIPLGTCPFYGNMPVCKEFRFFVDGGEIECFHPYWPRHALESGGYETTDSDYDMLCSTGDMDQLCDMASAAGKAVGGRWSVDLLETRRGWFLTDMAEADKSFHWEDCPAQAIEARRAETLQDGSVHESAVGNADAPNPGQSSGMPKGGEL